MKKDIAKQFFTFLEKKEGLVIPLEAALSLEMKEEVLKDGTLQSFRPERLRRIGLSFSALDFFLAKLESVGKIKVQGDVFLNGSYGNSSTEDLRIEFMKKELEIFGNYTQINISLYPQRIVVYGDITLKDHPGYTLPKNLKPEKSLEISSAYDLEILPENLHIPEDLSLRRLPNLKSIPGGLKIERNLFLSHVGFLEKLIRPSWKASEKKQIIRDVIEERGGYVKGDIFFP